MNILEMSSKQLVVIVPKGDTVPVAVHCDQLYRSSLRGARTTRLDLVMIHAEDALVVTCLNVVTCSSLNLLMALG